MSLVRLVLSLFTCLHEDDMLRFEEDRVCLRCPSCGRETPGWRVARRRAG